jgi:receptor protein-tyrosine kinase
MAGAKALVLEADFRRPAIAEALELRPGYGLADVLVGHASAADALQEIEVPNHRGLASRPQGALHILQAGAQPPNPAELLESQRLGTLLNELRSEYALIVIDTPPLTFVSDAFPVLHAADGVLVVGRVGWTRRDAASRLRETLAGSGAPVLGVVVNGLVTPTSEKDYHAYGTEPEARPMIAMRMDRERIPVSDPET